MTTTTRLRHTRTATGGAEVEVEGAADTRARPIGDSSTRTEADFNRGEVSTTTEVLNSTTGETEY